MTKAFLDQKPGTVGRKLGSNTDRGYADVEHMHGLETCDVTNTSAQAKRDARQEFTHDLFKERSRPQRKMYAAKTQDL